MKRFYTRIATGVVIAAGFASWASNMPAQAATANAIAKAIIIKPISIVQTTDLDFAKVVTDTSAQTVVVDGADTRTSCTGALVCTGTVASAAFSVDGGANTSYTIAVTSGTLTINNAGSTQSMTVDTFTFNPTSPATLSGSPPDVLKVGATLNVGANQAEDSYGQVGDTFTVEVLYQ